MDWADIPKREAVAFQCLLPLMHLPPGAAGAMAGLDAARRRGAALGYCQDADGWARVRVCYATGTTAALPGPQASTETAIVEGLLKRGLIAAFPGDAGVLVPTKAAIALFLSWARNEAARRGFPVRPSACPEPDDTSGSWMPGRTGG